MAVHNDVIDTSDVMAFQGSRVVKATWKVFGYYPMSITTSGNDELNAPNQNRLPAKGLQLRDDIHLILITQRIDSLRP